MQTRTSNVLEALGALPPAAVLVLENVTWDEYEDLLDELDERPGLRITYDQGRLDIVSTSTGHEAWKESLLGAVHVLSEELRIVVETRGGTTYKRKRDRRGTEPDTCVYVTHAREVIGKNDLDLESDPPPDIVVEIDKSNQSLGKFPIYAGFGVSEIWRYNHRRRRVELYELRDGIYVEIPASRLFTTVTGAMLTDFIIETESVGQTAALAAFRKRIRERR